MCCGFKYGSVVEIRKLNCFNNMYIFLLFFLFTVALKRVNFL